MAIHAGLGTRDSGLEKAPELETPDSAVGRLSASGADSQFAESSESRVPSPESRGGGGGAPPPPPPNPPHKTHGRGRTNGSGGHAAGPEEGGRRRTG
ncbi:hypothetical protein J2Y70_001242, partial [Xanthomonas translucens]|nr:hypothetical protein [Xanthomonas translucens]